MFICSVFIFIYLFQFNLIFIIFFFAQVSVLSFIDILFKNDVIFRFCTLLSIYLYIYFLPNHYLYINHTIATALHSLLSLSIILSCFTDIPLSFKGLFTLSIHLIRRLPLNLTPLTSNTTILFINRCCVTGGLFMFERSVPNCACSAVMFVKNRFVDKLT